MPIFKENFNQDLAHPETDSKESSESQLDAAEYGRKMSSAMKQKGFAFYEDMLEFRKNLLNTHSEDELRQYALYHVLIGSTPEAAHNWDKDTEINRLIAEYRS